MESGRIDHLRLGFSPLPIPVSHTEVERMDVAIHLSPLHISSLFIHQEPITQSLHLSYKPYETTFARIFLFLETVGLLDWRALYAKQYNIIQYNTAQHNSTQQNTIQCTILYAVLGI